jgi:NAD(P)-dependent dehydrogenase (short-subunit alcohol dehydrogenase family)
VASWTIIGQTLAPVNPRPTSARLLDRLLDLLVAPGYTSLGYRLRGLSWASAVAGRLDGKLALVTGASSGLGEATCEGLARAGARVLMVVRDRERGREARERIASSLGPGAQLEIAVCDLARLASVRDFARRFSAAERRLDVLVNNAGILPAKRERTCEGFELAFATNVLGPFLLTGLLAEPLRRAGHARVINVSSGGMYTARLDAEDPQLEARRFDGPAFYAHTKRAEVALTEVWAERLAAHGISCHSMHPGWADTPGIRRSLPRFHRVMRPLLRDPRQGADTIVWLASADRTVIEARSGELWHDRRPRAKHRVPGTRESLAERERLWAECARLTRLTEDDTNERRPPWLATRLP